MKYAFLFGTFLLGVAIAMFQPSLGTQSGLNLAGLLIPSTMELEDGMGQDEFNRSRIALVPVESHLDFDRRWSVRQIHDWFNVHQDNIPCTLLESEIAAAMGVSLWDQNALERIAVVKGDKVVFCLDQTKG